MITCHSQTLSNGLRIVAVEMPHLHSAEIAFYIKVGGRNDPTAKAERVAKLTALRNRVAEHLLLFPAAPRARRRWDQTVRLDAPALNFAGDRYRKTDHH